MKTAERKAEQTKTESRKGYFALSLFLMLLSNRILFDGARIINSGFRHWDLHTPLDGRIPFLPWTFTIYAGVLLWWLFLYWLISQRERREADRFFGAILLAKALSFLVFVLFPTAMQRPALSGDSVWITCLRALYLLDAPVNLFPSVHCLLGWICWIGVRGKKDIPLICRAASLLLAAAVCVSTLTVRQHVLPDVFAGIAVSELAYQLAGLPVLRGRYGRFADGMLRRLGGLRKRAR